jgi:hypothetical protein
MNMKILVGAAIAVLILFPRTARARFEESLDFSPERLQPLDAYWQCRDKAEEQVREQKAYYAPFGIKTRFFWIDQHDVTRPVSEEQFILYETKECTYQSLSPTAPILHIST